MGKKLIIKTILVCVGIFILIFSGILFYVSKNYEFDNEPKISVLTACYSINEGDIINGNSLIPKTIKASAFNEYMITNPESVLGKKVLHKTLAGDYIRVYDLLPPQKWCADDDRIIVIQADMKTRIANLIKKGSFVDVVTIPTEGHPEERQLVLSKIKIDDVLDEVGQSTSSEIGNKTAFLKFTLNKDKREKLSAAMANGSIGFELYCNELQPPTSF